MKQYVEYFKYVLEHKKNVFIEMWNEERYSYEKRMIWYGLSHDLSKFSILEFKAYANWFHSKDGIKNKNNDIVKLAMKQDFEKAWQHHKDKNKHHWNYWYERKLYMPYKYVRQMLIDWNAMSRKFGGSTEEYYLKNYDNIKFTNDGLIDGVRDYLELRLGVDTRTKQMK